MKAIKEMEKHYNVINIIILRIYQKKTLNKYTVDGLYLNNDGYKIIADKFIEGFISKHK